MLRSTTSKKDALQQQCSSQPPTEANGFSTRLSQIHFEDIVQDKTVSSLELSIAAFNPLINQKQPFLDSHLARVLITPNQQATR